MTEYGDISWCPCQRERFPDIPERDLQYVVDYLQEVKSHHYYRQKRSQNRTSDLGMTPTQPTTPRTRRGVKIIDDNFPDADLVCPWCEKEYVEEITRNVILVEE